jgi:hypothetical protein
MTDYSQSARHALAPLLRLRSGGPVALRFLAPLADPAGELGIVPDAPETFTDYLAPDSHVRELDGDELSTLAGQFRQGAREVLLSDTFAQNVTAAQGLDSVAQMFEAAAGALLGGQVCRIRSFRPLRAGDGVYAWQLLCDSPLEAASDA